MGPAHAADTFGIGKEAPARGQGNEALQFDAGSHLLGIHEDASPGQNDSVVGHEAQTTDACHGIVEPFRPTAAEQERSGRPSAPDLRPDPLYEICEAGTFSFVGSAYMDQRVGVAFPQVPVPVDGDRKRQHTAGCAIEAGHPVRISR